LDAANLPTAAPPTRLLFELELPQFLQSIFGCSGKHDFAPVVADYQALVGNGDQMGADAKKAANL
jgi:hypothetical protein